MPAKKVSGTEMTSAQGQEITRNVNARCSHSANAVPGTTSGGTKASNIAAATTAGV